MKILILPSTTYEALIFAQELKKQGHYVIGAANIESEFTNENYFDELIYLPHITDDTFFIEFESALLSKNITHFWTSVDSIYAFTQQRLKYLSIELLCCDPMERPPLPVKVISKEVELRAPYYENIVNTLKSTENLMPQEQVNSLIFNALSLPGQSYLDKLLTIVYIFSTVPKGDIIEIGSLWGRSAMLFSSLANQYNKGHVLCVDPWPSKGLTQGAHKALDDCSENSDMSDCFNYFVAKLSSLFSNRLNYIRQLSDDAINNYKNLSGELTTKEFGSVKYDQQIALLHIDGNHGFKAIKSDVEKWCPLVVKGGWIIFDDYNWTWGDGPKVVVDLYLVEKKSDIELAFFCGGAMFVKLRA
jgi:hypothetical protein